MTLSTNPGDRQIVTVSLGGTTSEPAAAVLDEQNFAYLNFSLDRSYLSFLLKLYVDS